MWQAWDGHIRRATPFIMVRGDYVSGYLSLGGDRYATEFPGPEWVLLSDSIDDVMLGGSLERPDKPMSSCTSSTEVPVNVSCFLL